MSAPAVVMYSSAWCGYCQRAKHLLERKGVPYTDIPVDGDPASRQEMEQRTQRRTVPQIFIGDRHVGGCDELHALERSGELDTLLAGHAPANN